MAILFLQQRKFQKKLIFLLFGLLLITSLIIWWGFLGQEEFLPQGERTIPIIEEVPVINFSLLEDELLKELQLFPEIEPIGGLFLPGEEEEEGAGRENPFLPY